MLQYTTVLPETLELLIFLMQEKSLTNFHLLKSLTYFEDSEEEADPKIFTKISWEQVKIKIEKEVHDLF